MRKRKFKILSFLSLCVSAASQPAQVRAESDVYVGFQSPTGNIHCGIHLTGGATIAECQLREFRRNANENFEECEDLTTSFGLWDKGQGRIGCTGSNFILDENPKLAYGGSIELSGITCSVAETGVTCKNQEGNGFTLSRESQEFFSVSQEEEISLAASSQWDSSVVFSEAVPYDACLDADKDANCLKALGFDQKQIDFLNFVHGGFSAQLVPRQFYELGQTDLVVVEDVNHEVRYPALLNGSIGYNPILLDESVQDDIGELAFTSGISNSEDLMNVQGEMIAHRKLEDGTQRFIYREVLTAGCKRCEISASAISFFDVAPGNLAPLSQVVKAVIPDNSYSFSIRPVTDELTLEIALTVHGYDVGLIDGLLTDEISMVIRQFQKDNCKTPTGKLTAADLHSLASVELHTSCNDD